MQHQRRSSQRWMRWQPARVWEQSGSRHITRRRRIQLCSPRSLNLQHLVHNHLHKNQDMACHHLGQTHSPNRTSHSNRCFESIPSNASPNRVLQGLVELGDSSTAGGTIQTQRSSPRGAYNQRGGVGRRTAEQAATTTPNSSYNNGGRGRFQQQEPTTYTNS